VVPVLTVRFFATAAGAEPVRDWLKAQPDTIRKALGEDIKTVQYGWPLGMPLVRKLESRLWEIRAHFYDGIARILFTLLGNLIVLLHAFIKKTDRIAAADIELARHRCKELHHG
jgi:phage-related protein